MDLRVMRDDEITKNTNFLNELHLTYKFLEKLHVDLEELTEKR